ncbi:hypothetical protein E2C01_086397 [Portunus trituberculatus]|uniref:Uncharacterized protein n=1 Tax=Portunus trituberculatus TaxID=210409 RepID=A0A5B7JBD8_PORTR|nr:hypothetical protein [Portunus trituberculatus]
MKQSKAIRSYDSTKVTSFQLVNQSATQYSTNHLTNQPGSRSNKSATYPATKLANSQTSQPPNKPTTKRASQRTIQPPN